MSLVQTSNCTCANFFVQATVENNESDAEATSIPYRIGLGAAADPMSVLGLGAAADPTSVLLLGLLTL